MSNKGNRNECYSCGPKTKPDRVFYYQGIAVYCCEGCGEYLAEDLDRSEIEFTCRDIGGVETRKAAAFDYGSAENTVGALIAPLLTALKDMVEAFDRPYFTDLDQFGAMEESALLSAKKVIVEIEGKENVD